MKMRFWNRLPGRAALLTAIVSAVVLITGGLLFTGLAYRSERRAAINTQEESACRGADVLSSFLQEYMNILQLAAASAPVDLALRSRFGQLIVENHPELLELLVTDESGTVILRAGQSELVLENFDFPGESDYMGIVSPDIVLSVPIITEQRFEGRATARLDMQSFQTRMAQIASYEDSTLYLLDSSRTIIVHPELKSRAEPVRFPGGESFEASIYTSLSGESVVGAVCPIAQTTWFAVSEVPIRDAYVLPAIWRSAAWIAFSAVIGMVNVLAGWWVLRVLILPIYEPGVGMRRVRDGDYTYTLSTDRHDEVGELITVYEEMRVELQLRNQQITEFNRNLELRVARRTEELKAANRRMEAIAEALYQASQRADSANRAKSQFLANMSHELRTPLNSMILYHDLLLRGAYGELNEKQKSRLLRSRESANVLLKLIGDVLDLAKIEAGEMLIERREVQIKSILETTGTIIEPLLKTDTVKYSLDLPPYLPPVIGDSQRIQQITLNLLSNAAKFTHVGEIKLSARHVMVHQGKTLRGELPMEIAGMPDGEWIAVVVRDTGIGIPEDKLELVFDEFKQVDDSNTREAGGTGLGLAICKRLIAAQGGHIGVMSTPGEGSRFWFVLGIYDPEKEDTNIVYPLKHN
ncbi:MAG TPA: ATP-binding protein [Aggregatilineales bacterium]|nr:ATP-binding protein [Aggregatilineales bacterium]